MKQQESTPLPDNAEVLAKQVHLLHEAATGHLDGLQCPECSGWSISVWFTRPADETYRTWFICKGCNFHTRAQNSERPHFFDEHRVRLDLDELDKAIIEQAIFKKPMKSRNDSQ